MAKLLITQAKYRGCCEGCMFYAPNRIREEHKFHQHCLHGQYQAPQDCYETNSIYVDPDSVRGKIIRTEELLSANGREV